MRAAAGPQPLEADRPAAPLSADASIVVVTCNNLVFNRLCLESLLCHTRGVNHEIIVVDNGSDDGTAEYVEGLARRQQQFRVILNGRNMGFAPACNQGLRTASGLVVVLLNNDTIVPPGWLPGLLRHLDDPAVGLVGPVTNRAGNEAQIETSYRTYGAMLDFARGHRRAHDGRRFDIRTLTMFCTAWRRSVLDRIGVLDEQFESGLFEDDDYSMRVRQAGYRVVCAEDVFVHHFGQATIGNLAPAGRYGALFHANRRRWEAKWRMPWQPYDSGPMRPTRSSSGSFATLCAKRFPVGRGCWSSARATTALLEIDGMRAAHFPQGSDGGYAGYNPADGAAAVRHLEDLRTRGAEFLVFPATSLWWMDYYTDLRRHLEEHASRVASTDDICWIFSLDVNSVGRTGTGRPADGRESQSPG